ncbi:signal peptide peptidase SppA, 36K type [Bacteroidales bacterium Barb4]|nr:signal peptide peptidase SppA, 36K type [Bacteroidales bacterium Barb4]
MRIIRTAGALLLLVLCFSLSVNAKKTVYVIDITKEIDNTTRLYLINGLHEAQTIGADAVLLHLNTYGGLLDAADSMRTAVLYSPVPVYVFIDNNAASAGALISIACKAIYMRKGASIGAASVVNQTGEILPDKYQSYMRSMMRATAEAQGKDTVVHGTDTVYKWRRDPLIAEAMVDERTVVPLLSDSGKVLTLTANEAVRWGYCDGIAETAAEVITQYIGYSDYDQKQYTPSLFDNLKGFLMNPALQSILILIIIGGIYFELQTPGMGFPSAAAVGAAVLYFAPLYMDGLAQNWEILVFIAGLILIMLEVFVIPGFGVAGIAGIVCIVAGLTMSLLDNVYFDFEGVTDADTGRAALTVLLGLGGGFFLMLWLSHKIGSKGGLFRKVALTTDLEEAVASPVLSGMIGQEGIAATVLRPSGKVLIDGVHYDGVSESGFIEKGEAVRVVRFENAQLYVTLLQRCNRT